MSSKTIDSLPKEMLLHIFCFLGHPVNDFFQDNSLKNASLVCKQWRDIIFNSIATMKQLSLNITEYWDERKEELLSMNRNFYRINVSNVTVWNGLDVVFLLFGAHIRELKLSSCSIQSSDFNNILSELPMLQSITIYEVQFQESRSDNIVQICMKNLKSIVLAESTFMILKYLMNSHLHSLKICSAVENENDLSLLTFFLNQDTLEELALHNFKMNCSRSVPDMYKNLPMKLLKLSLHGSDNEDFLLHLIEGQANSIRVLEIEDQFFSSTLLNSINNLETLHLIINKMCTAETFCHNLHSKTSIKTLLVTGDLEDNIITSNIFDLFPEVTTLGLESKSLDHVHSREILKIIADCLPKVENLLTDRLSNSNVILFKFPLLKTVVIKELEDMSHSGWTTFVKNNTSIESLILEKTYSFNDHSLAIIAKTLKNIKHLKLGYGFKLSINSAKLIKKHCKNLKTLDVNKELLKDDFDFYKTLDMKNLTLTISSNTNCVLFGNRCLCYEVNSSITDYSCSHYSSDGSVNMFNYSDDDENVLEVVRGYCPG
ncbi:unnamed protein product [Diamesa serratosioi]